MGVKRGGEKVIGGGKVERMGGGGGREIGGERT